VSRRLYIYWKVEPSRLVAATQAARAFQGSLAGIEATLLRRADEGSVPRATLMETYASPGGLSADDVRGLIERSATALAAWADGGRHAEVFEPA
jgi:hypothetical protein